MALAALGRLDAFFWEGWDHRRLWVPRWQWPSAAVSSLGSDSSGAGPAVWLLVAFRFMAFGYAFGYGVWEWACGGYEPLLVFPSYLTYDTMWLVTVYFFFANIVGMAVLFGGRRFDAATRARPAVAWAWWHACRAAQAMHSISVAFALVVVLLYWLLIFTSDESFQLYRDVSQHGIYFALISIDVALGCNRPPDRQALVAFFAGVVYLLYNLGYTKSRFPVYSILKWTDGWSAIISLGALAAMQAVYFGYAGLCAWRDRVWLLAGGAAYAASLRPLAPPPVGTGAAAAAAPPVPGLPPFVGLGDAPLYHPFFADAASIAPCATCCACCVVRDPQLQLQKEQGSGVGAGAAKQTGALADPAALAVPV